MSDNKRIAKNTIFLYFRMILTMTVTLFTSRIILDKLGIDDYGLYNVVGGVVGMVSFINGTLSAGTSRFLMYELGGGDKDRLKLTFSTAFFTHFVLGIIIVILMETAGLWFLYNKLVIPPERFTACVWVFQLSILTTFISITQVPYTSTIMAHEQMNIYAYISIFEAFAKLGVCYLLSIAHMDRLIFYAILLAIVQFVVAMSYRVFCIRNYDESSIKLKYDKSILKSMLSFSGWNVMANLSNTLNTQGVLVLINLFFTSAIAAAQSIASQVSGAIMVFVNNFRIAINPQIIKLYAAGDKDGSKKLTLESTVFCFDLILMIGLPAIVVMNEIMHIWLKEVPEYAVVFTQWIVVCQIIGTFSASFHIPMMAANKMKINSIAAVVLGVGEFILLFILLKIGFGPMWIQYLACALTISFSMIVKPYVLIKQIGYTVKEIIICFWTCLKTLLLSIAFSFIPAFFLGNSISESIIKVVLIVLIVALSSYLSLDKQTRNKMNSLVQNKVQNILKK